MIGQQTVQSIPGLVIMLTIGVLAGSVGAEIVIEDVGGTIIFDNDQYWHRVANQSGPCALIPDDTPCVGTGPSTLVTHFGSRGNICDNSWGEITGTVWPSVIVDGVSVNDASLLPSGSYFRSGIMSLKAWCPEDTGFYGDCPGYACALNYNIDGQQGSTTAQGNIYFDVPTESASDGVAFSLRFCNREITWGQGCGIVNSYDLRWRLSAPGPFDAHQFAENDTQARSFPDADISISFAGNPAGTVTAIELPGPPPFIYLDSLVLLSGFRDIRTDMPESSFSADLSITYNLLDLPAGTNESGLVVALYDAAAEDWVNLPTSVEPGTRTVSVQGIDAFGVFVLLAPEYVPECGDPPSDLVSWWPGDQDAGDIWGGNEGTLMNGASIGDGVVESGFHFDGVDDYVNVGDRSSLDFGSDTDFTIEGWIKTAGAAHMQNIVDKRQVATSQGYIVSVHQNGIILVFVGNNVTGIHLGSTTTIDDNAFHHFAAVFDRDGFAEIYVDGALDASADMTSIGNLSNSGTFTMGRGNINNPPSTHKEFVGVIDELRVYKRALGAAEIDTIYRVVAEGLCDEPEVGEILGRVVADCPSNDTGLYGITVDAFEVGTGDLKESVVTDSNGSYEISELLVGDYTLTIVTPLGYSATAEELPVTVAGGGTVVGDFSLVCLPTPHDPRGKGFWKHQVGIATGGRGNAQIEAATLCNYLDLIEEHFNSNEINDVTIYEPPASGLCEDKLLVAKELLNLRGNAGIEAKANQHMLVLLLNVAAGYIGLTEIVSDDSATVSQAITYCDNLIDDPAGDHELAKDIAEAINKGATIAGGVIPIATPDIAYSRPDAPVHPLRVSPNPGSGGSYAFSFGMPAQGAATLKIYNIAGREVAEIVNEVIVAGSRTIHWDGRDRSGRHLNQGIYFARLTTLKETQTIKFVHIKR